MKVGIVVPHIFMHGDILPHVIFSPGKLGLELAAGLQQLGVEVTLFTPGKVDTAVLNVTADLSYFEAELAARGDSYIDLLKKHPATFIALARQVQSELIAKAYGAANRGELDVVHIYTNEEDIALQFAKLCQKPVIFTHHDPFNFLVKYRNVFPKYKHLNWLSMSYAQRATMPADTNWVGNIYHGVDPNEFKAEYKPLGSYVAYLGRIIEPKGVHLAIQAVKKYNTIAPKKLKLKIAGKHYADSSKDAYWQTRIKNELDEHEIEYVGHIKSTEEKQALLGNARALIVPSTFEEPFGMVMIEALACGTPVIGLKAGSIPEVIKDRHNGLLVAKAITLLEKDGKTKEMVDEDATSAALAAVIANIGDIERKKCRQDFKNRFSLERMCREHFSLYEKVSVVIDSSPYYPTVLK